MRLKTDRKYHSVAVGGILASALDTAKAGQTSKRTMKILIFLDGVTRI